MTLGRDQSRSKAYPTSLWELFYRLRAKKSKEEEGSKEKKRASKGLDFGDTSARFLGYLEDTKLGR